MINTSDQQPASARRKAFSSLNDESISATQGYRAATPSSTAPRQSFIWTSISAMSAARNFMRKSVISVLGILNLSKFGSVNDERLELGDNRRNPPPAPNVGPVLDEAWIGRFAAWNLRTFGPGMRTAGTVDHIRKECREIEANPTDPKEWVDIILLGINGLVRQGRTPAQIIAEIHGKHEVNEARTWPDWRNHPDSAIEHDRSQDTATALEGSNNG